MKLISPFGHGLMFFARFFSKKVIGLTVIIFDHLKEPAAGGKLFFASKNVGSIFSEIVPLNQKSWLRP